MLQSTTMLLSKSGPDAANLFFRSLAQIPGAMQIAAQSMGFVGDAGVREFKKRVADERGPA